MKFKLAGLVLSVSLVVTFIVSNAFAAGETMCSAKTTKSDVDVYLVNSRMVAAPVVSGEATVNTVINTKKVNLKYDVKAGDLHGYWSFGKDLKILFYSENDANAESFETYILKIEMVYDDKEEKMVGDFSVIHNQEVIDSGPVTCELG